VQDDVKCGVAHVGENGGTVGVGDSGATFDIMQVALCLDVCERAPECGGVWSVSVAFFPHPLTLARTHRCCSFCILPRLAPHTQSQSQPRSLSRQTALTVSSNCACALPLLRTPRRCRRSPPVLPSPTPTHTPALPVSLQRAAVDGPWWAQVRQDPDQVHLRGRHVCRAERRPLVVLLHGPPRQNACG
jgi:hypothetical protein